MEENKVIEITEKGMILCEVWKLQTIIIILGILNCILQIGLIAILLLKL